jgi:hypothetical protein
MPALVAVAVEPAFRTLVLAPNAEVVVTPNDTLTTKSVKVGDKFKLSTVLDVMQDGVIVIPRGTVGEGTVTYRSGTGAFGKSGKMEVEFNYLDLNGQRIPLSGKHREEGAGNTGAAVGAVVIVGVFGAFVTGHSSVITNGQELRAHTAQAATFTVPINTPAVRTATIAAPALVATPAAAAVATPAATPAAAPVLASAAPAKPK